MIYVLYSYRLWWVDCWYIIAHGVWLIVQVLVIGFAQNIRGCDYFTILLFCKNYISSHCSMLSSCWIKAIVCSIRYFNWQKFRLLFDLINRQLLLVNKYPVVTWCGHASLAATVDVVIGYLYDLKRKFKCTEKVRVVGSWLLHRDQ